MIVGEMIASAVEHDRGLFHRASHCDLSSLRPPLQTSRELKIQSYCSFV